MRDEEEEVHSRALQARPLWKRNRARTLKLDNHMCRLCTFRLCLHVHHIRRRADGGTDALENLITLCPNHHALAHAGLLSVEQLTAARERRKRKPLGRLEDWSQLIEYVARECAAVDGRDAIAFAELRGRLVAELPDRIAVLFGPDVLSASPGFFRAFLRDVDG